MKNTIVRAEIVVAIACSFAACSWAQQPNAAPDQGAQQQPGVTRSPDSTADDLAVPECPAKFGDGPETNGIGARDPSVKPPRALHTVEAEFSDQARRVIKKKHLAPFAGVVLIRLVVDENGNPQNICLQRSLGLGLDANAARAVEQYRFAPATKDGEPVPERISVEVNYKLW
jgi:TonB family protein